MLLEGLYWEQQWELFHYLFGNMDLNTFIDQYVNMKVAGRTIHCPYWKNKLVGGIVTVRGMFNGKGTAEEIREALEKVATPDVTDLTKLARRQRIGIDCSGFAYRYLDLLTHSLDKIFPGGINKTNVLTLTNPSVSNMITDLLSIQQGDLIRMTRGRHVLVIDSFDGKTIEYVHSADSTKISGVHRGQIEIINSSFKLEKQQWEEEAVTGENFAEKHFHPEDGDGIYRLGL
jgi:hypothetical protein